MHATQYHRYCYINSYCKVLLILLYYKVSYFSIVSNSLSQKKKKNYKYIIQSTDNGVTRGWIDGFIFFFIIIYLFSWASILLRSVNPCLLQGKMCDRGGIELLQSKNENGWRSLDWHQPHRISFSGRGPCVVTWLGTNSGSGIGTTY